MRTIQIIKKTLLILVIGLSITSSANAQQTISAASLSGRVEDSAGAIISAARIVAKNSDTNQMQNVVSDENGRFRFPYLPVGNYEITCEQDGYAPLVQKMTATVGQAIEVVLNLSVAQVSEQVQVTSADNIAMSKPPERRSPKPLRRAMWKDCRSTDAITSIWLC